MLPTATSFIEWNISPLFCQRLVSIISWLVSVGISGWLVSVFLPKAGWYQWLVSVATSLKRVPSICEIAPPAHLCSSNHPPGVNLFPSSCLEHYSAFMPIWICKTWPIQFWQKGRVGANICASWRTWPGGFVTEPRLWPRRFERILLVQ